MVLILVGFLAVLALGIGLYAVSLPQGGRAWWALAGSIVALVIAGLLTGGSLTGTICLDLAELAGVALVWSQATREAAAAARAYLYSILPAIACTLIAFALIESGANRPGPAVESLVVCLVIVGFALKLGLIPFYFWLPAVAAAAAPMTTALIVSVVDIATFAELAAMRQASPWIFTEHATVWMVIALLSMFGGALLALAQTELKRMLAFSTIADLGFLLLGLVAGGPAGLSGAWIGALSHALSKVILFGAVGLAEARIGRTVTLDTSGLGARLPLASAAFIVGALSFIGVPPGFGFVGYWRIYSAATQLGGLALDRRPARRRGARPVVLRACHSSHLAWTAAACGCRCFPLAGARRTDRPRGRCRPAGMLSERFDRGCRAKSAGHGAIERHRGMNPFAKLLAISRRKSPWIYTVNSGSCNGCDIEIGPCVSPRYDGEQIGILRQGSPKHADILLVTGTITRRSRQAPVGHLCANAKPEGRGRDRLLPGERQCFYWQSHDRWPVGQVRSRSMSGYPAVRHGRS